MHRKFFSNLLTKSLICSFALFQAAPMSLAQATDTEITVNLNFTGGTKQISPLFYGIKDDEGTYPCYSSSPAFKQGLSYLGNKFFRVMQMSMTCASNASSNTISAPGGAAWIDFDTHQWDEAKILATLNSIPDGSTIMIGIPKWPYWMNDTSDTKYNSMGRIDPNQIAAYAKLCGELVYIVNVKNKRHVAYWEPMNECDGYFTSGSSSQTVNGIPHWEPADLDVTTFAKVYNQCAIAMKMQDPTIKVGGPALARGDVAVMHGWVQSFVAATGANLDFFSAHFYPSGSINESNATILNYPLVGQSGTYPYSQQQFWSSAVKQVAAGYPSKYIPTYIDEFNINPNASPSEPRQQNTVGAVFDALMYVAASRSQVAGLHAHDSVGPYFGKFDLPGMWFAPHVSKEVIYPGGHLQHFLNTCFVGKLAWTQSPNENLIVPYAVQMSNGRKSLLLANRSSQQLKCKLAVNSVGGFSGSPTELLLSTDDKGNSTETKTTVKASTLTKDGISLPPYSVAIITGQ